MKKKVISYSNKPMQWPIGMTAISYLLLDRFRVPDWAWGMAGTALALVWIAAGIAIFRQEQIDIFEHGKSDGPRIEGKP